METYTLRDEDVICHFCDKRRRSVEFLIAGHRGVFICNECVELCNEIYQERITAKKEPKMNFKAVRKELSVPDVKGNESSKVIVDYDSEFNTWTAYANLTASGATAEETVLALEDPTNDLLRVLRGSQAIGKVPTRKRLRTFEASTKDDAEQMRLIRNSCRTFMTNDQAEISEEEQVRWFTSIDRTRLTPLLAVLAEPFEGFPDGYPVGYGISRIADGGFRKLITGGIVSTFRGKGLGEELFRDVITWAGIPCWLEVLDSNKSAFNLYKKLGFKTISSSYQRGDKAYTLMCLDTLPL